MFLSTRRNERGDTIVEVLIAAAIISLVLVSAYGIANRSARSVQATQERIQGLHLAESQLEALRANNGIATSGNCFSGTAEQPTCTNFTLPGSGATYQARVNGPTGLNVYQVSITWESLGGITENLNLSYRLK